MKLPTALRNVCPSALLCWLVVSQGLQDGAMFLYLHPPLNTFYIPQCFDRISDNSLTQWGAPTWFFFSSQHQWCFSQNIKCFGLSSELVCELGGWKNREAFGKHNLSFGAAKYAEDSLEKKVVGKSFGAHKAP